MRYPELLKKGATIGLVAPSFGVSGTPYEERFEYTLKLFQDMGYNVVTAKHLRGIRHAKSTSGKIRAREFMQMYLDENVDFIISVAGGELMLEMLPYVNFKKLKKARPKFFMGLSDNTCLTFTLNTLCDVASIYGPCFGGFGMEPWDPSLKDAMDIITGKKNTLESYPKYDVYDEEVKLNAQPLDGYNLQRDVVYKTLDGRNTKFSGRLVGGCLDLLTNICGTQFDHVKEFVEKYKDDGIIWYLESCDLTVLDQYRGLWQLKNAGWFENCKGIMYGRPQRPEPIFDVTVKELLNNNFKELGIPVIYDMDFGHVAPIWTIMSGSLATVECTDGKGRITFEQK